MTVSEAPASAAENLREAEVLCRGRWRNTSSLRFALPVRFPEATYSERCEAVQTATLPGRTQALWRPFALPVDDLMPHVRRYLNAEGGDASTATLLTADFNELKWLTGGDGAVWTLRLSRERRRDFVITAAHLMLFRLDIAFLVVDVVPTTSKAADWFDLLHFGRFFAGDRARPVDLRVRASPAGRAALRVLAPQDGDGPDSAPDGPDLCQHLPGTRSLIAALAATALLAGEDEGDARQLNTPGQMLAYPVLFLKDSPGSAAVHLVRTVGSHHAERALTSSDNAFALTEAVLTYGENSWLFTSTEGAGFLAVVHEDTAGQFVQQVLPTHLRTEYFLAYLLAAFQRYALLRLSEEVAEGALIEERRFATTQARVLEFTGRAMFAQVTHSPHHQAWYSHVRHVHQVGALHQEVRDEVQAFQDFQRAERNERTERRAHVTEVVVAVITGVIVPLQLVTALFAEQVDDWPLLRHVSPAAQAYSTLVLAVALAGFTYLFLRIAGRKTDRGAD